MKQENPKTIDSDNEEIKELDVLSKELLEKYHTIKNKPEIRLLESKLNQFNGITGLEKL